MKVYKLTNEQAEYWKGTYNEEYFEPIKDNNGNWISGLKNADNTNFPFTEDLKKCDQIEFVPKVISRL